MLIQNLFFVFDKMRRFNSKIYSLPHRVYQSIMDELRLYILKCLFYEYQQGRKASDARKNICKHVHPDAASFSTVNHWYGYLTKITD
jgi:hypothetical protein